MGRANINSLALCLMTVISGTTLHAQSGIVVHDLSTGVVNGTTTLIAPGSQDDTWKVAVPSGSGNFINLRVCSNPSSWDINGCGRWVTNKLDISDPNFQPFSNATPGTYLYKTTFNLDQSCYPWAKVNFRYVGADDNIIGLSFNGHDYTFSPPATDDYNPLTQNVSINIASSHLLVGTNELIVKVSNTQWQTGFFACGNVTVGYCTFSALSGQAGTEGQAVDLFNVSPNPGNGHFILRLNRQGEGLVEIWDMMGRKVQQQELHTESTTYPVDLSSQPKGIYSVRTRIGNMIQQLKIVIQ